MKSKIFSYNITLPEAAPEAFMIPNVQADLDIADTQSLVEGPQKESLATRVLNVFKSVLPSKDAN